MICPSLVNLFKCPCYLDSEDLVFTKYNAKIEGSISLNTKCINYMNTLDIESFHFEVIKTPGHTSGSVCLFSENVVFTGDTIFKDGIGRYDLYLL